MADTERREVVVDQFEVCPRCFRLRAQHAKNDLGQYVCDRIV